MNEQNFLNEAKLSGIIVENFCLDHKVKGTSFYRTTVKTDRMSETSDYIPVIVPEFMLEPEKDYSGLFIEAYGQIRTFNKEENGKNKVLIRFFTKYMDVFEQESDHVNDVQLRGFLTKNTKARHTSNGRSISEAILAVNRRYHHSDYIPCIFWGRNAWEVSKKKVGTEIKVFGRIQSREYMKYSQDGTVETKTAYEVSVYKVEEVADEKGND